MLIEKIKEFLEKENKSLTDGFKYLLKSEYAQLTGFNFERQFLSDRELSSGDLRFSSAGKCVRALAYDFHDTEKNGRKMDDRAYRTFFIGDMTETMIVLLAKAAGVPIFGYGLQQPKVSIKIGETEIHGHPDGFIIHEQGIYSLEVKSMNTRAYDRFESGDVNETGGIDEGHYLQVQANLCATGLEGCLYVAFNKDTSVLGERLIPRSEATISQIKGIFKRVLESSPADLPERPHVPNEKRFLPWNCLYCSHSGTCYPTAKKVLVGKSYKLQVPVDRNKEAEATLISQSES